MSEERDEARRKAILTAARWCFLNFGYAKTSLDDIAKRAGISRPLIYRKFKNKEALFAGVFEDIFEERYPLVDAAVAGGGTPRAKLFRIFEIVLLEPWAEMVTAPMASEFYDVCVRLYPEVEAKHERRMLKWVQSVLPSRELAELFMLAVDGLQGDLPPVATLRRRLKLLVDQFVA